MLQSPPPFHLALLAPRHWAAWIGIGCIKLLTLLPRSWLLAGGRAAGSISGRLMRSRRHVALRNLALCFPELSATQRAILLRQTLRDSGLMMAEFSLAWMGSRRAVESIPLSIEGLEHLRQAREAGRGVLLVGAHFSHLELCARLVSMRVPIAGMYRQHDDAAFEWAIRRARLRYAEAMFTREQLRQSVRHLKRGGVLWYAPDQDMRGKETVFVPFFGVPASTITATHHLARLSGALVMPFFHRRLDHGGYAIRIEAPLADFPSADPVADTARVNACIERMVREAPSQYLWLHKRFKTRPPGWPAVY